MKTFLEFIQETTTDEFLKRIRDREEHGRLVAKALGVPAWHDIEEPKKFDIEDRLHREHRFSTLHPNVQNAVKDYTEYDAGATNEHLYSKAAGKRDGRAKHFKSAIGHLDKATTAFSLSHPLDVYRGTSFNPSEQVKDGILHLPGFTSTSLSKHSAAGRSRHLHKDRNQMPHKHIIHFRLKPGQKGLYVGDHSSTPREKEFLLPRNLKARIHPKPKVYVGSGGLFGEPAKYHVWTADIED